MKHKIKVYLVNNPELTPAQRNAMKLAFIRKRKQERDRAEVLRTRGPFSLNGSKQFASKEEHIQHLEKHLETLTSEKKKMFLKLKEVLSSSAAEKAKPSEGFQVAPPPAFQNRMPPSIPPSPILQRFQQQPRTPSLKPPPLSPISATTAPCRPLGTSQGHSLSPSPQNTQRSMDVVPNQIPQNRPLSKFREGFEAARQSNDHSAQRDVLSRPSNIAHTRDPGFYQRKPHQQTRMWRGRGRNTMMSHLRPSHPGFRGGFDHRSGFRGSRRNSFQG